MSVAKSEAFKAEPVPEDYPTNPDGNGDQDAQTVATSAVDALSVAPSHPATEIL